MKTAPSEVKKKILASLLGTIFLGFLAWAFWDFASSDTGLYKIASYIVVLVFYGGGAIFLNIILWSKDRKVGENKNGG